MKLKAIGIAVTVASTLFAPTHAADPGWVYQPPAEDNTFPIEGMPNVGIVAVVPAPNLKIGSYYTAVFYDGSMSDPKIEVRFGAIEDGKQAALKLLSHGNVIATIDMDGTIHDDGADPKLLIRAIYMMARDVAKFGVSGSLEAFEQKLPELDHLK